jgi:hypothetical protein
MANQKLHSELTRLRREQSKAREAEVFGGFSRAERGEYEARANRIHDVEIELDHTKPAERDSSSDMRAAGQKREWDKTSETDTPQSNAHQPYRSREKDSANAFTDLLKTGRGKRKNGPQEGREKK